MTVKKTPLAITGMACRLPGAKNVEKYWDLLINGRCAISRIPDDKLDRSLYYSPEKGALCKTCLDKAGLVEYESVNASKYPFPTDYAKWLEPQHWAICATAAEACRNAGMDPFALSGTRVGVYLGNKVDSALAPDLNYSVMIEETARYLLDLPKFRELTGERAESVVDEIVAETRDALPKLNDNFCPTISSQLMAAAVTRALKLDGPSIAFDAACSSSLHALAVAARDLALGNIDAAIVGGVAFYRLWNLTVFSAARALTTNNSRPFSDFADGFVYSEGYDAIVVKTLDRALADGDPIQAVVRGVGVSSDGKGKSLWAPSSDGQYKAIMRAYDDVEDMARLAYLEAHATSTSVGDLTELQSLTRAFAGRFQDGEKRPMGAVKANIGHTLASAGVAGLIKAILVLQKNLVPPQINCEPFNTKVDWDAAPFYVPRQATALPRDVDGKPRMAGVNSFGVGGLNVYAVVEDAPKPSTKTSVSTCETPKEPKVSNGVLESEERRSEGRQEDKFEPIAVIGASGIIPGARTAEEFEKLIFSDQNVFSNVPKERWNAEIFVDPGRPSSYRAPAGRGGFIRDYQPNWRKFKIPPKQIANADPMQFMVLDALDSALVASGYDKRTFDRDRVGVVVASSFAFDFELELNVGFRTPSFQKTFKEALLRRGFCDARLLDELCDEYFEEFCKHKPAVLDETGGFTASSLASRLTKAFDLSGGATALEAGGVGALAAFATAMNVLRTSDADLMFVAACSRALAAPTFIKMGLCDRLADGQNVRAPFDARGGKTVPSEGVGVFVLKRLSDALRDGDPIQFVLRGVGFSSVSPKAPRAEISDAFERAISRAWAQTSFKPNELSTIELAVADSETSLAELDACAKIFPAEGARKVALGSIEPQFGDMSSASGAVATLKAATELAKGRAPKLVGYSAPKDSAIDALRKFADPAQETTLKQASNGSFLANVNSWDPCGFAGCLVVERRVDGRYEFAPKLEEKSKGVPCASKEEKPLSDPWRLVRFGASTKQELAQALREGRDLKRPFVSTEIERAVVVVPNDGSENEQEIRERLENAAKQLETREKESEIVQALERLGIVYAQKSKKLGKIAFMFSGQGSQYPSMLQDLIQTFEPAKVALKELDETLRKLGEPTFEELTVGGSKALGVDVFRTQLSLLCADWIVFRSLQSLGIRPDVVAGHSFGEFPALVASGAWTLAQGVQATRVRCEAIVECDDVKGTMTSTNADGATAKRICELFPGQAFAANFNAPTQTVVGAYKEVLPELEKKLQEEKFLAKTIPVPRPFHTPLMAPVRPLLEKRLVAVRPRAPQTPFVSSVTNRPTSEPDEILQNLAKQMTAPIDYIGLTRFLVEKNDVELLVESGPKRVLTGLHQKIIRAELAENPNSKFASTRCFAPDAPGRENGLGFYQLRALCEARGYFDADSKTDVLKEQGKAEEMRDITSLRRNIIRETLIERADRLELNEIVASQSALESADVEAKRQILALATILKIAPEALAAWLFEVCDGDLTRRDLAAVALDAADAWSDPLQKVADSVARAFAKSQPRAVAKDKGLYLSPVEFYDAMKKGEPDATFPNQKYRRFRVCLVPREFPALDRDAFEIPGAALIYGLNATSKALAKRLIEKGCDATILPCSGSPEEDARLASEICEQVKTQTLFLFASHDEALLSAPDDAREARRAVALGSFFVTQSWLAPVAARGELSSARLLASTASGGGFGFDAPSDAVEVGALAGLVKSLFYEIGAQTEFAFRAQIVDFSKTVSPEYKSERVFDVMTADVPFEIETGFIEGRRVLVRPLPIRAKEAEESQKTRPSGLWVVTGGGRGVTAFLAREIAKRYGLKLALVGSSPAPNVPKEWVALDDAGLKILRNRVMREATLGGVSSRTAWNDVKRAIGLAKSLEEFAREGVEADYYSCDVTDGATLAATLEQIRRDNPTTPISGVFHGAGIEISAAFLKKNRQNVAKTFDIKTEGARNLIESTQKDPLRWFLAMGSMAGRFGGIGQSDYSCANDCMAKILDNLRAKRPECRASLFHWGPWDELGMAVRPETASSIVMKTFTYLPPKEGLNYVLEELESDPSEPVEKALAPYEFVKPFYALSTHIPTEAERQAACKSTSTTKEAENVDVKAPIESVAKTETETDVDATLQEKFPIVEKLLVHDDETGYIEAQATLLPASDPFLLDHRLRDRPFLPAVISMETFCEAFAAAYPDRKVATIANLTFKNGLGFPTDAPKKIKIKAQRLESFDDVWNMTLCADYYNSKGVLVAPDCVYSQCVVKTVERSYPIGEVVDGILRTPAFDWIKKTTTPINNVRVEYRPKGSTFWHGESLRQLQTCAVYDSPCGRVASGEVGVLPIKDFAGAREGEWLVPAASVDACLYLCGVYRFAERGKQASVPLSFGSVTFARTPRQGERCRAVCRALGEGDDAPLRFVLLGEDERALLVVDGYRTFALHFPQK